MNVAAVSTFLSHLPSHNIICRNVTIDSQVLVSPESHSLIKIKLNQQKSAFLIFIESSSSKNLAITEYLVMSKT